MPRIAFVFPGQGAQYPGMGKELAGQICGLVNQVQPAAEIVADIISDACKVNNILGGIECQE